jgi:hypothetical protein
LSANFTSHSLSLLAFFLSLCLVCYSALIPEEPDSLNTRERITFPPFFSTISLLSFCLCCLSSFSPTRSLRALLYIYSERERERGGEICGNENLFFSFFGKPKRHFFGILSGELFGKTKLTLYIYIYLRSLRFSTLFSESLSSSHFILLCSLQKRKRFLCFSSCDLSLSLSDPIYFLSLKKFKIPKIE